MTEPAASHDLAMSDRLVGSAPPTNMADAASWSDLSMSTSSDEVDSPPFTKHRVTKRQEIESNHAAFTEALLRSEDKVRGNLHMLAGLRQSQPGYDELEEGPGTFTEAACNRAVTEKYEQKLESQGRKFEKQFRRIVEDWTERECYYVSLLPPEERAMQYVVAYAQLVPRMRQLDLLIVERLEEDARRNEDEHSSSSGEESVAGPTLPQVEQEASGLDTPQT